MPDYRSLPSVNELAGIPELQGFPERIRIEAARATIATARQTLESGIAFDWQVIALKVANDLTKESLTRVLNMSGVILHTGLGRAPHEGIDLSSGYSNLEFDMKTGKRGDRQDHVRKLLCDLTGAEDTLVVNNAAAAVFLTLAALCKGKQVLLSRGQSVEIGGSFRMPEIVKSSGCKLIDVGATNKTYVSDYLDALTPQTQAILRCHPSNFEIRGFTAEPTTKELASAAEAAGVLLIHDQGNGALVDFAHYGISGIETLPQSVAAGADISIASGDKLLGGPQCGIILGSKELIRKIAKHPIARVVRIDKLSLFALEQTLRHYRNQTLHEIPLHRILSYKPEEIKAVCQQLAPPGAEIKETMTELGSGAGAGRGVPSFAIVLPSSKPDRLLEELRCYRLIGRIQDKSVWLDPRTEAGMFIRTPICIDGLTDQKMPGFSTLVSTKLKERITGAWEKWK